MIATFIQGMIVGALVEGLPMKDGHYIGGTFGWLIGAVSAIGLLKGVQHRNDLAPFRFATLIFYSSVRHLGLLVLALHDSILAHRRTGRFAERERDRVVNLITS